MQDDPFFSSLDLGEPDVAAVGAVGARRGMMSFHAMMAEHMGAAVLAAITDRKDRAQRGAQFVTPQKPPCGGMLDVGGPFEERPGAHRTTGTRAFEGVKKGEEEPGQTANEGDLKPLGIVLPRRHRHEGERTAPGEAPAEVDPGSHQE